MDRTDTAQRIAEKYRIFVETSIGALLLFVDTKPLTLSSQRELRVKLSVDASESLTKLLIELSSATAQIDKKARTRALIDADQPLPNVVSERVDSVLIRKQLISEYNRFVVKILNIYKMFQMQARSLIRTGNKEVGARVRSKLAQRRDINALIGNTKSGNHIRASWLMFLGIANHLALIAVNSYIGQAAKLGYSTFYVINAKVDHNVKYSVDELPYELFHSQSSAILRLVET